MNILMSLPKGQADKILNEFETLTPELQTALAFVPQTNWKETDFPSPPSRILDIIVTPESLAVIQTEYPALKVLAAFNIDGSQVGTTLTITYDELGVKTETIAGTPTYPINTNRMRNAMPDVVTFDEDGVETGITPQTVLSDNLGHVWAGYGVRRYG